MDLTWATAGELAGAIARKELSSRELLDHVLGRIDLVNPQLNAVVTADADRAVTEAAAADETVARGDDVGPLHGVVMTVKDVWETEGMRTTCGAPELSSHIPDRDADAIARLRQSGAVIVGKTNTPQWAADFQTHNEVFGITRNPWSLDRTVGGSSGGSAAALAAGLTPLELGSDIGGSIRNPAHFCGVVGHKPSYGTVSLRGHIPFRPGALTIPDVGVGGPLARTVSDVRTAMELLLGPTAEDAPAWTLSLPPARARRIEDLKIGVYLDDPGASVGRQVATRLRAAVDRLADAGADLEEVKPPYTPMEALALWFQLCGPAFVVDAPPELKNFFAQMADGSDLDTWPGASVAGGERAWNLVRAQEVAAHRRAAWAEFFGTYDALLCPIMPVPAFPHDTDGPMHERRIDVDGVARQATEMIAWAVFSGAVHLPATVVPVGLTDGGLPVGMQIVGPLYGDWTCLTVAAEVERIRGPLPHPPLVT